ncbi:MAG: hypothetical protein ACFE0O_04410 [Opitutales bacterium]
MKSLHSVTLRWLTITLGAVCLALSVHGQETTGPVISEIGKQINQDIRKLEESYGDIQTRKESFVADLADAQTAFEAAADSEDERQAAHTQALGASAEINRFDRELVGTTQDTLFTILGRLDDLLAEVEASGNDQDPQTIYQQKLKVADRLNAIGPIVSQLKAAPGSKRTQSILDALEGTLEMNAIRLAMPAGSSSTLKAEVHALSDTVGQSISHLAMVEDVLEIERNTLRNKTMEAQVVLTLGRVVDLAGLDDTTLKNLGPRLMEQTRDRLSNPPDVLKYSPLDDQSDKRRSNRSGRSPAYQDVLNGTLKVPSPDL